MTTAFVAGASTQPGFVNPNNQQVIGPTGLQGTDRGQSIYVLRCRLCAFEYGANGSDIWQRHCPRCNKSAAPGFDVSAADVALTQSAVPSARNPAWSRDELILALDLYIDHRAALPDNKSAVVAQLSEILNALGRRIRPAGSSTFRNQNGVYMKLANFRRFDPDFTAQGKKGLSRGNKDEEYVWNQFANNHSLLKSVANAIKIAVVSDDAALVSIDDDDQFSEAPEGRILSRLHRSRERNSKLVAKKKARTLKLSGRLVCEVCNFDFAERYGARGYGFIEAHHIKPVHTLSDESKTHIDDLALVCSNCHRMIHASRPWLSLDDLKAMLLS